MVNLKERRRFVRLPFSRQATLEGPGGHFNAHLQDISLYGARLRFDAAISSSLSGHYRLTAFLAPNLEVHMTVSLVSLQDARAGFRCESIDNKSLANLKRALALFYGEGEALDEELKAFHSLFVFTGEKSNT